MRALIGSALKDDRPIERKERAWIPSWMCGMVTYGRGGLPDGNYDRSFGGGKAIKIRMTFRRTNVNERVGTIRLFEVLRFCFKSWCQRRG